MTVHLQSETHCNMILICVSELKHVFGFINSTKYVTFCLSQLRKSAKSG
jgi:hypothetical protein